MLEKHSKKFKPSTHVKVFSWESNIAWFSLPDPFTHTPRQIFRDTYNYRARLNVGLQDGYAKIGNYENDKRERGAKENHKSFFLSSFAAKVIGCRFWIASIYLNTFSDLSCTQGIKCHTIAHTLQLSGVERRKPEIRNGSIYKSFLGFRGLSSFGDKLWYPFLFWIFMVEV